MWLNGWMNQLINQSFNQGIDKLYSDWMIVRKWKDLLPSGGGPNDKHT